MKDIFLNYYKSVFGIIVILFVVISCQSASSNDFTIKVYSSGKFTGNYLIMQPDGQSTSKSVEGIGDTEYKVKGNTVSCSFQKGDESGSLLRIEIYKNNNKVKSEFTNAGYGVVSITAQ